MSKRVLDSSRYSTVTGLFYKNTSVPAVEAQDEGVDNIVKIDQEITNAIIRIDLHVDGNQDDWLKIGIKTDDSLSGGPVIGLERGNNCCQDKGCSGMMMNCMTGYIYKVIMKDSANVDVGHYNYCLLPVCQAPLMDEKFRIWLKLNGTTVEYKYYRWVSGAWSLLFSNSFVDSDMSASGYIYLATNYSAVQILQTKIIEQEAKAINWSS